MTKALQKRKAYVVVGGVGVFISVFYLGMAIELPFGKIDRPGAAILPVIVGAIFLLASIVTVYEGLSARLDEQYEMPDGADRGRVLRMVGLLALYFVSMPVLGNLLSAGLFAAMMIRLLGDAGWTRALVFGSIIAVILHFGFVNLLQVQMPRGILFG
jgi:putative tricarboxylic transport membrane protein